MKSKKSCYDPAVSHITVKRFGLIGLLYTIGLVLITIGTVNGTSNHLHSSAVVDLRGLCTALPLCNLAYAAVLAQLLLGDLYTPRLSYALRSLPIPMGGWFGTQVILGIVSVLPGILISGGILALQFTAYKEAILVFMASALLSFLFFYGAALLSGVCAGNRIGMLLIYCIINFIGLFYGWAVMQIFSPLIFGMYLPNYTVKFVPFTSMLRHNAYDVQYAALPNDIQRNSAFYFGSQEISSVSYSSQYLWTLVGFALLGCVLIGLCVVLLRRRKPESAGDLLAFRQLSPVLLVICSLCTGVLMHIISDTLGWEMKLPMLFFGIILGYYAALMLLKRQTNVFTGKALLPLLLILAVAFGGITATGLNLWGTVYRVPDADKVEKAEIRLMGSYSSQDSLAFSDAEGIALAIRLQQEALDDHRQIERSRPLLTRIYGSESNPVEMTESTDDSTGEIAICYTLKNGRKINRMYPVRSSYAAVASLKSIFSAPEYVFDVNLLGENLTFDRAHLLDTVQRVSIGDYLTSGELYINDILLKDEDIPGLIDAILQDCEEGTMAQNYLFHHNQGLYYQINFYYPHLSGKFTDYGFLYVFEGSENTIRYLSDHGADESPEGN